MPKMHQNAFADPAKAAYSAPKAPSRISRADSRLCKR